jgi:cytoskeleton protein RodZ
METLPALLRHTREQKGLSLKDVQAATRIPLRYLEVLEGQGDRSRPADYAYLIPFLRTYAIFLGLDPTTTVTQFITELQGIESKGAQSERTPPPSRSSPWTLPLVSLIVLVVVFTYMWRRNDVGLWESWQATRSEQPDLVIDATSRAKEPVAPATPSVTPAPAQSLTEPPAPAPTADTDIVKATVLPEPTVPSSPSQPLAAVETPTAQPSPPPAETSHLLRVEAKEQTWIRVVIDNQQHKDVLLKPGEKIEWKAKGGFLLTLGNAGGVVLNLNGKELPPLGKSGQVLRNIQLPAAG